MLRPAIAHRQVFGASGIALDALFEEMNASLDAYAGAIELLAVLYGAAVPAAVGGAPWRRYRLGDYLRAPDTQNPFAARIAALHARGAHFVVCNHSLRGHAIAISNGVPEVQEPVDAVLATLHAHLLPGITPVPYGVAALNAAQEAHYTYVPASL